MPLKDEIIAQAEACDSITDSSSCARSTPRAPGWDCFCVVVDSALRRRYPVSCALQVGNGVLPRGSGRVRFLRGPFAALLARMAALSCFPVAIVPLRLSRRIAN